MELKNRSRNDSATLPMIRQQVEGETTTRQQLADADVVIVSAGYNSVLPDPTADVGCTDPDWGSTDADFFRWSLTKTTPECIQAGFDASATDYDAVFGNILDLRAGKPTVLAAINVHDGNMSHPDLVWLGLTEDEQAQVSTYLIDIYDRWNAMLCERAAAAGFACVDVYHLFNGPTGEGSSAPWTIDNAHPNDRGSEAIAALLAELDISALMPSPAVVAGSPSPQVVAPGEPWIVYQYWDGRSDLRLVRPDGTADHPVFESHPAEQAHPDWSPDGSRLVFTVGDRELWTADVDGTDERRLPVECPDPCALVDAPAWSPDGTSIAFIRIVDAPEIPVVTLERLDLANGTSEVVYTSPDGYAVFYARWAPDGRRLVLGEDTYSVADGDVRTGSRIAVLDLDDPAEVLELTDPSMFATYPDWSPTDDRIVFTTYDLGLRDFQLLPDASRPSDLYSIGADGTDLRQLTHNATGTTPVRNGTATGPLSSQPTWTPDGTAILFVQVDGPTWPGWQMATIDTDGGAIRPATGDAFRRGTHPRLRPTP